MAIQLAVSRTHWWVLVAATLLYMAFSIGTAILRYSVGRRPSHRPPGSDLATRSYLAGFRGVAERVSRACVVLPAVVFFVLIIAGRSSEEVAYWTLFAFIGGSLAFTLWFWTAALLFWWWTRRRFLRSNVHPQPP